MKVSGTEREKQPYSAALKEWILPVLALLPGLLLILYYVTGPAAGHMTSDCTDSLRWGQASYLSGRLISGDFTYAALLPFGGNLIFWPLIALFGYGLQAQIWGMTIFMLLFAGALYYLGRGLKLGRTASAGLVSVSMLLLSSSEKLREIMWEHIFYYNLGILFFCVSFGLALRLRHTGRETLETPKGKRWWIVRLICLGLFSLAAGSDGLMSLVCCSLPVLASLAAERFLDGKTKLFARQNFRSWVTFAVILASSAAGFLLIPAITHGVKAGYADGYSRYSAMSKWTENAQNFLLNWLKLFGVSTNRESFMSGEALLAALRIFGALLLLILPFILLIRLPKIKNTRLKMLVSAHAAASALILFAVIFGSLGNTAWRLAPMLGTAILTTYTAAVCALKSGTVTRRVCVTGLLVLGLLCALPANEIRKLPADYNRDSARFTAAAELKARGLKYGYATFWWCELITVFSDNEVQASNMIITKENVPGVTTYQDYKNNYKDKDTDCYFLLLSATENETMAKWLEQQREEEKITDCIVIDTKEYAGPGGSGKKLYVYLFCENIF